MEKSQVTLKADKALLNQMQGECRKHGTSLTKEFTRWMQAKVALWEQEYLTRSQATHTHTHEQEYADALRHAGRPTGNV